MAGVGGQGIGLLSQALLRGIDHAGITAIAVDTHGLAQRGGSVVSRIRCGEQVHSPLIMAGAADLVLGMEIHEAMRGLESALKREGVLVFLNVSFQPLPVRLGESAEILPGDILKAAKEKDADVIQIDIEAMPSSRMQNMALLGAVAKRELVPGVSAGHYEKALADLLPPPVLASNLPVFRSYAS